MRKHMMQKGLHWPTGYRYHRYIDRLAEQKAKTGSVDLCVCEKGRKRVLGPEAREQIAKTIDEQSDITLREIVEKLELPVGIETARRAILAMGYRRKKKMIRASEQERPRCVCQERTMEWVCEGNPSITSGISG